MIGAKELLVAGEKPRLHAGPAAGNGNEARRHPRLLGEQRGELVPRAVDAERGDQLRRHAERGEVAEHVADAAQHGMLALHLEDRDRRLGRQPADAAFDVAVQHQVAHADHARVGEAREQRRKLRRVEGG